MGVSAVLTSPEFLFRIERDPPALASASLGARRTSYRISDLELATRLSFFLWSSIPDDELLDVAAKGDLDKPAVLERQVTRMLADPRSQNLVTNFASQWLHLRNLDSITPDMRLFPDFDDNLRQAFRAGDGAARRQRDPREPERARSAARQLHVRQRAAGQALRHPERLRQPVPPHRVRRRRRSAADCCVRAAFCW